MIEKITIIGVGLIGGSLAKSLKINNFAGEIIGFGRSEKNLKTAQELGIIDNWTTDIETATKSDIIVIATPVGSFKTILTQIKPFITDQIITDVGSTKKSVEEDFKDVFGNLDNFVPAHPIAGKEKTGCSAADENLFQNKKLIITGGSEKNKEIITKMWQTTGAIVSIMDSKTHDDIFALTSHLPHLLAFSFINYMANQNDSQNWTGGGFKDFSRIASSDSVMWADIFKGNKTQILKHLENYQQELNFLKELIEQDKKSEYQQYLLSAKTNRDSWV